MGDADGKLHLLQSRPITTLMGFDPVTGEFNESLMGDYVWSCVNVGEAMSVVMTPFTWSMMRTGFSELNVLPGHPSVGNIGGRLYQNVTVMDFGAGGNGSRISRTLPKRWGACATSTWRGWTSTWCRCRMLLSLPSCPTASGCGERRKQALKNLETYCCPESRLVPCYA